MDKAERLRYKTLANDAVIATFGQDGLTARLATALERCVNMLEYHGDCNGSQSQLEPEGAIPNLDTVQAIHKQLEERLKEIELVVVTADGMVGDLKDSLEDLRRDIKELGDEL
jgi:hypothetical protein